MCARKRDVPAVLARHGVPPGADGVTAVAHPTLGSHEHRRASGRTAKAALARVLAAVPAREG